VGITISPHQVAHCRARGLEAYELNYRNIFDTEINTGGGHDWEHAFDALVANGSLEHFVQVGDAVEGRADAIYEEMFAICSRLVHDDGLFVTTAIHFLESDQFDPREVRQGHNAHSRGSANYHYSMLVETMGGWYPEPGQLERCAAPAL
jgi:cyclopropane fatty-acyl-phospholipid synthase-like methyltransferase